MADENPPPASQDNKKSKVEDAEKETTVVSSKNDEREELDPKQVSQMLKMLGLSADAVTIPGTVRNAPYRD